MRDHKPISLESHLANLPLFTGIATADLERIAQASKLISAPKGNVLMRVGDACLGFHLLVFGQVKLAFTSNQGTEKIVEIVRQGQTFGESNMFLDKAYIIYAQTLQDSMLIHVPKAAIINELEHDQGFVKKMLAALAKRTHDLMVDIEAYSLLSAKQRIIGYLMSEMSTGEVVSDNIEFQLSAGKGVIASRLNITQEHFSRVLHELANDGLIAVSGKRIQIPSVSNLLKYLNMPL